MQIHWRHTEADSESQALCVSQGGLNYCITSFSTLAQCGSFTECKLFKIKAAQNSIMLEHTLQRIENGLQIQNKALKEK